MPKERLAPPFPRIDQACWVGSADVAGKPTYPFSFLRPAPDFLRSGSTGSLTTGLPTVGRSLVGLLFAIARRTARASELEPRAACFAGLTINKLKTSLLAEH